MIFRIVLESLRHQGRSRAAAGLSILVGASAVTAVLTVALSAEEHLAADLRRAGPNIIVRPRTVELSFGDLRVGREGSPLREEDLPAIHRIFWANNILSYAPLLHAMCEVRMPHEPAADAPAARRAEVTGTWFRRASSVPGSAEVSAGLRSLRPDWEIASGRWPEEGRSECLVGEALAADWGLAPGVALELSRDEARVAPLEVAGIVRTGGDEERRILAPLALVQRLAGAPGAVSEVQVSAQAIAEEDAPRDPSVLSPAEYDRWYCSPYPSTIAAQLEEAIPGSRATTVLARVSAETSLLLAVRKLLALGLGIALVVAVLGVGASMGAAILGRRQEIALLRALGATRAQMLALILLEAAAVGIVASLPGFLAGTAIALALSSAVFAGAAVSPAPLAIPTVVLASVACACLGVLAPAWRILEREPAAELKRA